MKPVDSFNHSRKLFCDLSDSLSITAADESSNTENPIPIVHTGLDIIFCNTPVARSLRIIVKK